MLKETLSQLDLAVLSTCGMILFVAVFLAVLFYAFTRAPRQTEQWARIPLTSEKRDPFNEEE